MKNQPNRASIWWNDAHGNGDRNVDHGPLMKSYHKPLVMVSTGWLIRDDDDGAMLVSDWIPEDEEIDNKWDYRGYQFIPRAMIFRTEYLLVKES